MNFFKKKCDHTEIGCNCEKKRILKNRQEFYFIPSIRFYQEIQKGTFFRGKRFDNGYKKRVFSIKFLNYKFEIIKQQKLKTK